MEIQLLRHATLLITINNKRILVDPMLSKARARPPIENSPNSYRNPLVELVAPSNFLKEIDAVLLSHTHSDHFDEAAIDQIPKSKLILCQPEDEGRLQESGFMQICTIGSDFNWDGIIINRTSGKHGTGEIALAMAPVSGYVLKTEGEPSLYIKVVE